MAEHHHPTRRLHHHLDQVARHGARITEEADTAAAAHEERRSQDRPDDGRETLPTDGS